MHLRVINLDDSIASQSGLIERFQPEMLDFSDWGPWLRMTCAFGAFRRFERRLRDAALPPDSERPALTFLGSGDFHHVTLALLRQLSEPFNLLVIDKHPDWMLGVPVMHCGTWVRHALRLPTLRRLIHIGGDLDFDNLYRWLAPWRHLRSGRITVIPAHRHFRRGAWARLPHQPLMRVGDAATVREVLDESLGPHLADLERFPLYISLDKDAMSAQEAAVNWDSGTLAFQEVCEILNWFAKASHNRLAGMDVVGDWSPVRMWPGLRTLCHWTEHPAVKVDPAAALEMNQKMNEALVEQVLAWSRRQAPRLGWAA